MDNWLAGFDHGDAELRMKLLADINILTAVEVLFIEYMYPHIIFQDPLAVMLARPHL